MKKSYNVDVQTEISRAMYAAQTTASKNSKELTDSVELFGIAGIGLCVGCLSAVVSLGVGIFINNWPATVAYFSRLV